MATRIPENLRDVDELRNYFETKFTCSVRVVALAEDIHTFEGLLQEYQAAQRDYVDVKKANKMTKTRAKMRKSYCCGESVDAEDLFNAKVLNIADKIKLHLKHDEHKPAAVAFVTVDTIATANMASSYRSLAFLGPLNINTNMKTKLAPEPFDIIWGNLSSRPDTRQCQHILSVVMITLLIFFYSIPISFLTGLTELENLSKVFPFLEDWVSKSTLAKQLVQGLLPTAIFRLFLALLPYVVRYIFLFERPSTNSKLRQMTLIGYYTCLVVMVFWVVTLSKSLFAQLSRFVDAEFILSCLAQSLPGAAGFFMGYIILYTFVLLPMEFIRLFSMSKAFFRKQGNFILQKAERIASKGQQFAVKKGSHFHLEESTLTPFDLDPMQYDKYVAQAMIIFLISFAYCVVSPLMHLFGAAFFFCAIQVWKYQLLYVYGTDFDLSGGMWPIIFSFVITSVIILQITTMSVFFVKKATYQLIFSIPIVVLTIWFSLTTQHRFRRFFKHLDPVQARKLSKSDEMNEEGTALKRRPPVLGRKRSEQTEPEDFWTAARLKAYVAPALRIDAKGNLQFLLDLNSESPPTGPEDGGEIQTQKQMDAQLTVLTPIAYSTRLLGVPQLVGWSTRSLGVPQFAPRTTTISRHHAVFDQSPTRSMHQTQESPANSVRFLPVTTRTHSDGDHGAPFGLQNFQKTQRYERESLSPVTPKVVTRTIKKILKSPMATIGPRGDPKLTEDNTTVHRSSDSVSDELRLSLEKILPPELTEYSSSDSSIEVEHYVLSARTQKSLGATPSRSFREESDVQKFT